MRRPSLPVIDHRTSGDTSLMTRLKERLRRLAAGVALGRSQRWSPRGGRVRRPRLRLQRRPGARHRGLRVRRAAARPRSDLQVEHQRHGLRPRHRPRSREPVLQHPQPRERRPAHGQRSQQRHALLARLARPEQAAPGPARPGDQEPLLGVRARRPLDEQLLQHHLGPSEDGRRATSTSPTAATGRSSARASRASCRTA